MRTWTKKVGDTGFGPHSALGMHREFSEAVNSASRACRRAAGQIYFRRRTPRASCPSAELEQVIVDFSKANPTLARDEVYRRLRAQGVRVTLPLIRRVRAQHQLCGNKANQWGGTRSASRVN